MLKYIFIAEFDDGTFYTQDEQDIAKIAKQGSAFTDVLELQKDKKLIAFTIICHDKSEETTLSLSLISGRFILNGKELIVEGDKPVPINDPDYRLIFYRQHQHDFNPESQEETAHRVTYFIGWQTTVDEKNYQSVVGIT